MTPQAAVNENLIKFHSKLNEFRLTKKHSDVTITCETENFECHRVILASASGYFDAMFGGSFKESADQNVVLHEMSADIFKEVVQFIYTGDVTVNHSNVYGLLQASEFLDLTGLERLGVRFVEWNTMSVENTFDVFMFACATKKKILIDLLSLEIVKRFRIFSRSPKFLEISFDNLHVLMNRWASFRKRNDEELYVSAFIRWLSHCPDTRSQYIEKYFELFRFKNLTSKYTRFIFTKQLTVPNTSEWMRTSVPIVGFNEVLVPSSGITWRSSINLNDHQRRLNVYIQCVEEDTARVFTIGNVYESEDVDISDGIFNIRSNQGIRTIGLDDDHLYSLHYPRGSSELVNTNDQSFRLYNSVDLRSGIDLKNPPVIFKDLRLCTLQNNIYACSKSLFQYTPSKVSSSTNAAVFSDEEIKRGTYVYNCDLNDWFPMPAMKKQFYTCSATTSSGILYLLGSEHPYEQGIAKSLIEIRAYDYRVGEWLHLPQGDVTHFMETDCCVVRKYPNDIIAHPSPQQMINYNIKAGKWQILPCFTHMMRQGQYLRLLSHSRAIWAVGGYPEYRASDLSVQWMLYRKYNYWRTSTVLSDAAYLMFHKTVSGIILDAVVF